MRANDLSRFSFKFVGSGHYMVTYSTKRGDYYKALVTEMTIIDATKNAKWVRAIDINRLRSIVVQKGVHYHVDGTRFYD